MTTPGLPPLFGLPWERPSDPGPVTGYKCPYCPLTSEFASPVLFHIATQHPEQKLPDAQSLMFSSRQGNGAPRGRP